MVLIGLSGWARSGKDTIADHLVKNHNFKKLSFGQKVKDALYALNPDYNGKTLQEAVDEKGWDIIKEDLYVRGLLQRMGTEVGRNLFGENFWVDQTLNIYFSDVNSKQYLEMYHGNFILSDVRFKNEADAIRGKGGYIWRINRPGVRAPNDHPSEHDLDDYEFDRIINNDGTLEELLNKISDSGWAKSQIGPFFQVTCDPHIKVAPQLEILPKN